MFREDYKKLMDGIAPSRALEQQTEREILEMMYPTKKQGKLIRRAACVAAAILLLAGSALAVIHASGILERLFPNGEPSQAAQEAIVHNPMQANQDGISLNIDEYIFDNNTLHLGWTVSSEREGDIFYTTSYAYSYECAEDEALAEDSIGGTYGAYGSGEVGDGILVHLDPKHPSHSGYAGYGYKSGLKGRVETCITVHAYETDFARTDVESAFDLAYTDPLDPASLVLEKARQIGVSPEHMTAVNGYEAYNDALQKLLAEDMEWDAACEAALTQSGIFREVAVLDLIVSVKPGRAAEPRFELDGPRSFELPDATVILRTLNIDTASTVVEYDVVSDQSGDVNDMSSLSLSYVLFDQDGNALEPAYIQGAYGTEIEAPDGMRAWRITHDGNPLPESVTSITFVPRGQLERRENEATKDYLLRVREAADPAACFTVELK